MGLFLAMSGVFNATEDQVAAALADYVKSKGGIFEKGRGTSDDEEPLALQCINGNVLLQFPSDFYDWSDASQEISRSLGKAVISLHIHDDDLWMYQFYKDGVQIDAFNPIPDYWTEDISEQEREANKGNAEVVARATGLRAEEIVKYLVTWDLESDESGKAYPGDQFTYDDAWQMCDFMTKLQIPYPYDEEGKVRGPSMSSYRFIIPEGTS